MEKKKAYAMNTAIIPEEMWQDDELKHLGKVGLTILCNRGIDTVEKAKHFIHDDVFTLTSSYIMNGTAAAIPLLKEAAKKKQRIIVYRDYDCDGCCAGAVAVSCLRSLGVKAEHYANDRQVDGYGMCKAGVDRILEKWPDTKIILTVDNGITAHEAVDYAKERGLIVIITDHHETGEMLPNADAVIDPKQTDEIYEFHEMCGTGVVFKLMLALFIEMKKGIKPVLDTLDIVALATVADVVPLIGENHTIVKEGLSSIREGERLFFAVMLSKLGLRSVKASDALAFKLAPIVNSASRMGLDTDIVVEMLLSEDADFIRRNADTLIETNEQRKNITQFQYIKINEKAKKVLEEDPLLPCLVLKTDENVEGIVGILAGKLREEYVRPVIVFSKNDDGLLKGSARCGEELNLKETLDQLPEGLLLGYGGHSKAAGMSLEEGKFEQFVAKFTELCRKKLADYDFTERKKLDLAITEEECTEQLCYALDKLEPYGESFPTPLLGLTAKPDYASTMGKDKTHLKYTLSSGTSVIMWGHADWQKQREIAGKPLPCKFIGIPSINSFNGEVSVQFFAEHAQ